MTSKSARSRAYGAAVALYGRRDMGERISRQAVDWAGDALTAGLDSPSLRVLAGFQEPLWWSEVEDIFFKTVGELGFTAPATEQDALWAYAHQTAHDLLGDRITPKAACHALYRICVMLEYPTGLLVWDNLDSAWLDITAGRHPLSYEEATRANFTELCKREARKMLANQESG